MLSADGKVLELAGGTFFLGDPSYGNRMLVRECYRRLYSRLEKDFLAGQRGRVIIGTPGSRHAMRREVWRRRRSGLCSQSLP